MGSCEQMEYLIDLSLDDMLPSQDRQALLEHLKECSACRARYEELRWLKEALGGMEEPVPPELHERIMTYVEQNGREAKGKAVPFRSRRWHRVLAGAAACAVIAVAAARFLPELGLPARESAADTAAAAQGVALTTAAGAAGAGESPESVEEGYTPSNAPITLPPEGDGAQDGAMAKMEASYSLPDQSTGQMAEDLPPLREETMDEAKEYRVATVQKWLKVTGRREDLPSWVDRHFVYEAELDGTAREYVEIAAWAEEYWTDQLTACGFAVELLEDQEVVEDGEHMLLIFFWEE